MIDKLIKRILPVYSLVYVIVLHIIAIGIFTIGEIDSTDSIADIVLQVIIIILLFALSDIVFLLPSIGLLAFGSIISLIMAISLPLFLFLSLFEILGATTGILDYGFIIPLLITIAVTPFGIMNLLALRFINRYVNE